MRVPLSAPTQAQLSLEAATPTILTWFDDQGQVVYSRQELVEILREMKSAWRLKGYLTQEGFLTFLLDQTPMHEAILTSPDYPSIKRYVWRDASIFDLAASLRSSCYFSHGTAAYLHGLTQAVPRRLYINREQSAKPPPRNKLTQNAIRNAFSRPQRTSRYDFKYGDDYITVLSGKHTNREGVITISGPHGRPIEVTNLERTLIDIVVRPSYAGGVGQVQADFNLALGRLSIECLLHTLRTLNHVYPYHQAIGFYLDRAGAEAPVLAPLRELGIKFDFYLDYGMRGTEYDPQWWVYYPTEE